MIQNIKEDFLLFKKSEKHILIFEICYKLLAASVIYPLVYLLVNLGMKMAGIRYLTNEYIFRTVTSPYVIAFLIIIFGVIVGYCVYEMSFMLASYEYNRKSVNVSFYATAYSAMRKMKSFFKIKNIPMLIFVIAAIMMLNITISGNIILTQTTRNVLKIYIKSQKWYFIAGILLVILFVYAIVFLGIYSFHIFFLEEKSFKQAFAKSKTIVLKHPGRTIYSEVIYNVLILAVIVIFYVLISGILVAGVKLLDMAYIGSTVYLSILRNVRFFVKVFLCCIAIPISFLVITQNYYKFTQDSEIEYPLIYLKERYTRIHRFMYGAVIFVSVSSLIINIVQSFNDNPFEKIAIFHQTEVTAHRGTSSEAPENTLSAFKKAMEQYVDCIELDVQMTMDKELVIMHDDTTLRTTGVDKKISQMTLAEVKKLDAGSWFSNEFAGEKVPTLQEVIDLSAGKVKLNIEIKANENGLEIAEKLADVIKENDAEKWCVVTSFDYNALQKVKECDENIQVGYILSVAYGSFYEMNDVDFFSVNASFLTKRTVDAIHNSGKEVYAWTVNSKDAIRNLTNKGVDNIITDKPILAEETVYSRDTSETVLNMLKYVFNQ